MTEATPQPTPKKSDLGVRTLSAIVMVAVAGTALWLGGWVWTVFVSLAAAVCLWEFCHLISKIKPRPFIQQLSYLGAFLYVGLAAFMLAMLNHPWVDEGGQYMGMFSTLYVIGVVVSTDIGAYFSGRTFGGPKIAPKISPSKTWAGLIGGMITAAVWSVLVQIFVLWAANLQFDSSHFESWMIRLNSAFYGAILAVVAQSGDFFESWLKRRAGVKDSSNLIPGHGGVFDRIDGLLPVVLVSGIFAVRPF